MDEDDENPDAAEPEGEHGELAPDAGQHDTLQDSTAGMADETTHAGKASARPELSFADLEARLAERARKQQTVDREGDDDGLAGAENSSDENTSDP